MGYLSSTIQTVLSAPEFHRFNLGIFPYINQIAENDGFAGCNNPSASLQNYILSLPKDTAG